MWPLCENSLVEAVGFCLGQFLGRHFDDEAHGRVSVVLLVVPEEKI